MTASIVVVGAGQAGARCAQTLRQLGYQGELVLIGDEVGRPYERPPLSKAVLLGEADPADAAVVPPEQWSALAIDHRQGESVAVIDRANQSVVTQAGARISYDQLVLATGVAPRRLNILGAGLPLVQTLHSAPDATALRERLRTECRRLVIIGGGFVGLEVAASARQMGWRVTILEQAPQCVARVLPAPAADRLAAIHCEQGVAIRCGVDVVGIAGAADVADVMLRDGSVVEADLVVMAVGSVPRTDLAAAAGLAIEQGVTTDDVGRTNDSRIWAIGDVARRTSRWSRTPVRLESWHNAEEGAVRAAHAMLNLPAPAEPLPWFWTDQYDHNVQILGLPANDMQCVTRASPDGAGAVLGFFAGEHLGAAVLHNSGRDRRVLARLIESGTPIDAVRFADPACPLAQTVRAAA
jgi:3-phenylpropionate/trans-cinnamate dioxygenase ferredoxin reductase component